jgi:hypothetical protein
MMQTGTRGTEKKAVPQKKPCVALLPAAIEGRMGGGQLRGEFCTMFCDGLCEACLYNFSVLHAWCWHRYRSYSAIRCCAEPMGPDPPLRSHLASARSV